MRCSQGRPPVTQWRRCTSCGPRACIASQRWSCCQFHMYQINKIKVSKLEQTTKLCWMETPYILSNIIYFSNGKMPLLDTKATAGIINSLSPQYNCSQMACCNYCQQLHSMHLGKCCFRLIKIVCTLDGLMPGKCLWMIILAWTQESDLLTYVYYEYFWRILTCIINGIWGHHVRWNPNCISFQHISKQHIKQVVDSSSSGHPRSGTLTSCALWTQRGFCRAELDLFSSFQM